MWFRVKFPWAYEKITKMRKAPITIAPSTILKLVSYSPIRE